MACFFQPHHMYICIYIYTHIYTNIHTCIKYITHVARARKPLQIDGQIDKKWFLQESNVKSYWLNANLKENLNSIISKTKIVL